MCCSRLFHLIIFLAVLNICFELTSQDRVDANTIDDDNNSSSLNVPKVKKNIVKKVIVKKTPPAIQLTGKWRENRNQRSGLYDYLYAIGESWFTLFYMTATYWQDEQTIYQSGNVFRINGFSGPKAEVYAYTVTADNTTISRINLGEKLGVLQGTSYIDPDEESLVTNLGKKGSDDIEVVIKRKRNKDSKTMIQTTKHIPSNKVLTATFHKF